MAIGGYGEAESITFHRLQGGDEEPSNRGCDPSCGDPSGDQLYIRSKGDSQVSSPTRGIPCLGGATLSTRIRSELIPGLIVQRLFR